MRSREQRPGRTEGRPSGASRSFLCGGQGRRRRPIQDLAKQPHRWWCRSPHRSRSHHRFQPGLGPTRLPTAAVLQRVRPRGRGLPWAPSLSAQRTPFSGGQPAEAGQLRGAQSRGRTPLSPASMAATDGKGRCLTGEAGQRRGTRSRARRPPEARRAAIGASGRRCRQQSSRMASEEGGAAGAGPGDAAAGVATDAWRTGGVQASIAVAREPEAEGATACASTCVLKHRRCKASHRRVAAGLQGSHRSGCNRRMWRSSWLGRPRLSLALPTAARPRGRRK
mmetsp:Transcript_101084/g.320933  ORF Transcript_101084/g.320933 Transcript_101084/m.320933 type:complete len:280 (-) Transcript_101084:498-1337(-)